ncbi:MAG: VWA domain-containing protein [Zoogloea sp.]|uniref:VWA domain-containing protein n=1 Tax=Zoogloea sp. TaxID=49181 RepID=UPI002617C464|nr:VWA domain-containing protein [Zoogloea sp.]MDD2990908.1 VWA domain-containing protein [Zoogloea sp.]
MSHTLPPLLLGLFRELKANGVPVGTRDYLDGVEALRLGFGQGDRAALRELASALWGRSDEERRLIARWFDVLPPPDEVLIAAIDDELDARDADTDAAAAPAAATVRPTAPTLAGSGAVPGGAPVETVDTSAAQAARARVSFAATREGSGLPIPRLASAPPIGEDYVLDPQPLISPRDMAVLWRRYRRSTRHGPRTEMDLAATLRERCRRGQLCRPVCRPRRSNSARLLILADASPSMDPWRPFLATLAASLPLGRLARAELRYFNNQPRRQLYATPDLDEPEDRDTVLRRHAGAALLVVSDAGSARGALNRRRALQTADFLDDARRLFPSTVWLNPMPARRWAGTTAGLIADGPVPMLPVDASHLLRAIDILRGTK